MAAYVPNRGDVVWADFAPQAGHEQDKRRPALVLSPLAYNRATGLFVCCPITSSIKGYPFEVGIETSKISGAILADQVKSFDRKAGKAVKISRAPAWAVDTVSAKLAALLTGCERR